MDEKILDFYNSPEGAVDYSGKFQRHWTERVNDWHEQRMLRGLLRAAGVEKVPGYALDLPCGVGRLYPVVRDISARVVEGDWSFHMLSTARGVRLRGGPPGPAAGYVRGTALDLPFGDNVFDFVLSVRLCHHIRDREERFHYVREILRVSRNWVVFTYFDETSLKNRWREFRRRWNKKRSKWTLREEDIREIAGKHGFEIVQTRWLSRFFSGHRYVVLRKRGASSR
ncbi:MAG: class I SAM-dependent methyltransferase [Myxococcota bacterium]